MKKLITLCFIVVPIIGFSRRGAEDDYGNSDPISGILGLIMIAAILYGFWKIISFFSDKAEDRNRKKKKLERERRVKQKEIEDKRKEAERLRKIARSKPFIIAHTQKGSKLKTYPEFGVYKGEDSIYPFKKSQEFFEILDSYEKTQVEKGNQKKFAYSYTEEKWYGTEHCIKTHGTIDIVTQGWVYEPYIKNKTRIDSFEFTSFAVKHEQKSQNEHYRLYVNYSHEGIDHKKFFTVPKEIYDNRRASVFHGESRFSESGETYIFFI